MRLASRTLGNGLSITRAYRQDLLDADKKDNLLASIAVETAPGLADRPGLSLSYTYDANRNMTAEDMGGVMDPYGTNLVQDAKDRMTSWTRDTTATSLDAQTWSLSFEHNWDSTTTTDSSTNTTQSRTHNTAHELLTIDPTPGSPNSGDELAQSYDPKGNLSNDAQGRAFTHDFDNMLSSVTISPGATRGTPGTHTYTYDAMGRRVSKTTNGTTTVFVCSNGQVLAEYTDGAASTNPDRKYIYGNYIDEPIALIDATGTSGGEETYYYHRNRQYSIIGLTNETGQVVERYAYTAYGDPTTLAPDGITVRTTSDYDNEYLHTGRRFEVEIGLYYYRARYYSPTLGQFLQRDPLGYPDGLNTYVGYHVMHGGLDPWGLHKQDNWYDLPSEIKNDKDFRRFVEDAKPDYDVPKGGQASRQQLIDMSKDWADSLPDEKRAKIWKALKGAGLGMAALGFFFVADDAVALMEDRKPCKLLMDYLDDVVSNCKKCSISTIKRLGQRCKEQVVDTFTETYGSAGAAAASKYADDFLANLQKACLTHNEKLEEKK